MQYDDDIEESVVTSKCTPNLEELFTDSKAMKKQVDDVEKVNDEEDDEEEFSIDAETMFIER